MRKPGCKAKEPSLCSADNQNYRDVSAERYQELRLRLTPGVGRKWSGTPAHKSNTILQEKEQELLGEEADAQAGAGKCRISQKHLVVLESRKVLN